MWQKVFDTIDSLADEYLLIWKEFCDIESPTSYKEGVDKASRYMVALAEKMGWQVEYNRQPVSGDCVCITMNPGAPGRPVAMSGHVDTVHPVGSFGNPATRIEGDKIFGPGVVDCKGGVVASFLAMAALQQCGFQDRPIINLLQSDEEISSITCNKQTVAYMGEKAKNCAVFMNTEGCAPGTLTIERKGIQRYIFDIRGRAVHSSKCYEGINPVTEAAHKILALEQFKDPEGITCNCSVIQGGTTPNTVPDSCSFLADFRYRTVAQRDYIEQFVRDLAAKSFVEGSVCTVTEKSRRICMERTDFNEELLCNICNIYEKTGLPAVKGVFGKGGSDAADMTARGIPCLDGFGVYGKRVHSVEEYAYIDSLAQAAKAMAAITLYL